MDKIAETAVLPEHGEVLVESTKTEQWEKDKTYLYVPLNLLAEDPTQPREHIDNEEQEGLVTSVKKKGVRESLTITPIGKAPWLRNDPEWNKVSGQYPDAFWFIVSGHRRWNAAREADLEMVPVIVRVYKDEKEHREDASILNKQRSDLSPLEEGRDIVRHLNFPGATLQKVADMFGHSTTYVVERRNLTRLAPDIQELLSPSLKEKKRIPVTVASNLGALPAPSANELDRILAEYNASEDVSEMNSDDRRFCLQRVLLGEIRSRQLGAQRAIAFIKSKKVVLSSQTHFGKSSGSMSFKPSGRREVIENLLKSICASVVFAWDTSEYEKILEYLSESGIGELIEKAKEAQSDIQTLIEQLEVVKRSRNRQPGALSLGEEFIEASYYHPNTSELIEGTVVPVRRYIELYEKGRLKFQVAQTAKPEFLPSLKEAKELLEKIEVGRS